MDNLEKSDSTTAIHERIYAPLTWNSPPYCEILDLKENHYEEVIRLIKHHYLKEDPMCRATDLRRDLEAKKHYLDLIRIWMQDSTSLIAISKLSGRVIGTIITRINSLLDKTNTYSRVNVFQGNALNSIMNLKSALIIQSDVYKVFNTDDYLRIYLLCVHPSYEKNNLSAELLYASFEEAAALKLKAVAGIFTTAKNQKAASEVGLKFITEIKYNSWIAGDENKIGNTEINGNYSAAFMGRLTLNQVEQNQILETRKQVWEIQNEKKGLKMKIIP